MDLTIKPCEHDADVPRFVVPNTNYKDAAIVWWHCGDCGAKWTEDRRIASELAANEGGKTRPTRARARKANTKMRRQAHGDTMFGGA